MDKIHLMAAVSAAVMFAAANTSAAAQTAVGASVDSVQIEDIVVTAEKRETTAQRTAIALTVLSQDTLTRNGVGDLGDLTRIAPSVNFSMVRSNAVVTIRGVSSRDTTEIGDPAVAISVDGFYYQRSIGLNDSVFDLERVEVLRGPQGTLYGRNATGGAINFITAKPTPEFAASGKVGIGNYNLFTSEGMVNVPIASWLSARASFATRDRDGFRNNAPAADGDDADATAGRLHLLFTPSQQLRILVTGEAVRLKGVGPVIVGAPLVRNAANQIVHERPLLPENRRDFPLADPAGFMSSRSRALRLSVDYDFGPFRATYLGGIRRLDFERLSAMSGIPQVNGVYILSDEKLKTETHEFRLASTGDGPFVWQLGAYYFSDHDDLYSIQRGFPIVATQTTAAAANFRNYFRYPFIHLKSKAAFAQASYRLSDTLKAEAGIRFSDDDKARDGLSTTVSSGNLSTPCEMREFSTFCAGPLRPTVGESHDKRTTYHAALNWDVTPTSLLYAKFDTGYKSGGFSDVVVYGPETLVAYELGAKNRFLENRVQLNLSAFRYDYKNQQVGQLIAGRTQTVNAGKSKTYGVEVEATALLGRRDRIDGSISYLHARFTDFTLVVDGANRQLAGNRPPQAPDWSISLGYEHDFTLLGGLLNARLQTHVESESFLQVTNYNSERQNPYMRSDVIVTYTPERGNWTLQGYVRNIEDTAVVAFAQERAPSYIYQFDAPRTYGATLAYRF